MLPQLSRQLLARWSELPIGRKRPDRFGFLGTRTEIGDGYALFLAFADRDPAPCLVVKIPREPAAEARLQHEWDTLHHFQRLGLHEFASSLPRPILWDTIGGARVLMTSAPSGQPMGAGAASEHLARVGDWLVQLACITRTARSVSLIQQELDLVVQRLSATFELSNRELAVVEDWVSLWSRPAGDDRAVTFSAHGNLTSRNVWLHRDRLTVVNWEHSELECLPLQDVFTFITTYRFATMGRPLATGYLREFRAAYLSDGPSARLAYQAIDGYCRALDIPDDVVEPCFGIFLARAALQEYDRLLAAARRGYLPLLSDPGRPQRRSCQQAIRDQVWINLLRLFIRERGHFEAAVRRKPYRQLHAMHVRQGVSAG